MWLKNYILFAFIVPHLALAQMQQMGNLFTETMLASFTQPTSMVNTNGGLLVLEKRGVVWFVNANSGLRKSVLNIEVNQAGERGLLGITRNDKYVYLYYTIPSGRNNRISRFSISSQMQIGKEEILFDLDPLSDAVNHNGGALAIHSEYLFFSSGENAEPSNAQSMNNILGKIGRLFLNGSIPRSNPYYSVASGRGKAIWCLGLRNPFSMAISKLSGRMAIADVGQARFEEINEGVRGANYGWPQTEGYTTTNGIKSPIFAYSHNNGACAVTGLAFYDPPSDAESVFPAQFKDTLFFGDFCSGQVRTIDLSSGKPRSFGFTDSPIAFHVDDNGNLFYLSFGTGRLGKISVKTPMTKPSGYIDPKSIVASIDQQMTAKCHTSGYPTPEITWFLNNKKLPIKTPKLTWLIRGPPMNNGTLVCQMQNEMGRFDASATIDIVDSRPPWMQIIEPKQGSFYIPGQNIQLRGVAYKNKTLLPDNQMIWTGEIHHDSHIHPFLSRTYGNKLNVTIPTHGETSRSVFFQFNLTVSKYQVARNIYPAPFKIPAMLSSMVDAQIKTKGLAAAYFNAWMIYPDGELGDTFDTCKGGRFIVALDARIVNDKQASLLFFVDDVFMSKLELSNADYSTMGISVVLKRGVSRITLRAKSNAIIVRGMQVLARTTRCM